MKTSELTGAALDWAVDWAMTGIPSDPDDFVMRTADESQSTNWAQGGPILSGANISRVIGHSGQWIAYIYDDYMEGDAGKHHMQCNRSELIAGLRCFVSSKLGDEIDLPKELT